VVSGKSPDGAQTWRIAYPPGRDVVPNQIEEYSDYITNESIRRKLAESLYYRQQHRKTITFKVKGIGWWCEPTQWIELVYDLDGDGTDEQTDWVIDKVTRDWSITADGKTYTTTINASEYNRTGNHLFEDNL
jgi:hypothetical protein